jgi:hypothetical protein
VNAKRLLWVPIAFLFGGVCLFCGTRSGTGPDDGDALFMAELEHYFASYDAGTSQVPIMAEPCSNASNDSSATGLDVSGEWIMVRVDIPQAGEYVAHLSYASNAGDVIAAKLEMDGCGTATTCNFLLDDGTGTG